MKPSLSDLFQSDGGWSEEDCLVHRVIVCGSRTWTDRDAIADRLFDLPPSVIVHGDAPGADRIAAQEGAKLGLLIEPHNYRRFITPTCAPKRAPLKRNEYMAELGAHLCIAFWKDGSTGTAHMVTQAKKAGIPVEEIHA